MCPPCPPSSLFLGAKNRRTSFSSRQIKMSSLLGDKMGNLRKKSATLKGLFFSTKLSSQLLWSSAFFSVPASSLLSGHLAHHALPWLSMLKGPVTARWLTLW